MTPTSPTLEREALILLHAPVGRDAKLLHEIFHRAGLTSQVCLSVEGLCEEMERGVGAIMVSEEALDPASVERLASVLKVQGPWSDVPLVVLTVGGEPTQAMRNRLARLEPLGDLTLLERPLRSDTIISAARSALRARTKQYEVRRRDAELQIVTDNVPVLISYNDRAQVFRRVNQTFSEWFGLPQNDVVGKTIRSIIGEPHYSVSQPFIEQVLEGETVSFESRIWDKHRKLLDVHVSYAPDFSSDGAVRGFVSLVQDISERKKSERQLRASEEQFRTLADAIPNLAWMAYPDGHIFWYNQRWFTYTGTTEESMEGWGWQSVHDPDILPEVLTRWRESLDTGKSFEMVFPLRGADSIFRPFLTRVEPIYDAQGTVVRWFGTNTDIDSQKRTETALKRANQELEEFAYVASHDLQEPLRMVNIYSQLLLRKFGPLTDSQTHEYAGFVRTGVKRMEALILDLLTYSRATHTEDEEITVKADLNTALQHALATLDTRVQESHAKITAETLPTVMGDAGQLAQVFQNLLSNALKYRKSVEPPRIHIASAREDGRWVISVRDNGIGFDPDQSERIFGLFKRLHRDEEYPGTGLGLAICKRIVERYHGHIWAESRKGAGSTFFVSLPAASDD